MKIAIASGKGGTGKTLVSSNLFYAIQEQDMNVSLVDCDAEEPNASQFINGKLTDEQLVIQKVPMIDPKQCTFCGKCQEYCSYNAILILPKIKNIQVVEELCHDCGACSYACNYSAISEKEKVIGTISHYECGQNSTLIESRMEVGVHSPVSMIKKAIHASTSAITLMDAPPGTSCPFIATVESADYVVLVTEPTPFGLNDLKLSVETLKSIKKPFGVILNRVGLGDTKVQDYLMDEKIELLTEIPFDRNIARTYSTGKLICKELPNYKKHFMDLSLNILNRN